MAPEFKKIALSIVVGILCFYAIAFLIGFISGVQTDTTQQPTEQATQTIIDNTQEIKAGMYYAQSIEVTKLTTISISLSSDNLVNYILLPEYELDHYINGDQVKYYDSKDNVISLKDSYNLDIGKYTILLTSLDKTSNVHLIITGEK